MAPKSGLTASKMPAGDPPNVEDRPGQLASNARRARAGAEVGGDQKAGRF
jgi:hypothetical protein